MTNLRQIVHRFFGWTEGPDQLRFGAGVVGHTARVIIALCAAGGAVGLALSGTPAIALQIISVISGVVVVFMLGTWWFAHKHPDLAAMGGADFRKVREIQMAAQGHPRVPLMPGVADPHNPVMDRPTPEEPSDGA